MTAKPLRVIPGKSRKHRIETRVFSRDIHETYCVQRGCKFHGKLAEQGICHTTEPFDPEAGWHYADRVVKAAEGFLIEKRKGYRKATRKKYIENLESEFVCSWMNAIFSLDALVRLRRENALL